MKKNVLLWIVAVLALAVGVSGCGSNDDNEIVNVDREIQAVSSGEGYEWGETDIDESDPLAVFFRGELFTAEWTGSANFYTHGIRDFFTSSKLEEIYEIDSREEFTKAYKGTAELPEVDFSRYTLIVGKTYGVNGTYKFDRVILTDKGTTYEMETIVRANAGGGGTEAFMDIYYWCLYPKLEKKEITLKRTVKNGVDPELLEQTEPEFSNEEYNPIAVHYDWSETTNGTWTIATATNAVGIVMHIKYGSNPSPEPPHSAEEFFKQNLPLTNLDEFRKDKDDYGDYQLYRQYYKYEPLEMCTWLIKFDGNRISEAYGRFLPIKNLVVQARVSWRDAKKIVENYLQEPIDGMLLNPAIMEFPDGEGTAPRMVYVYKKHDNDKYDYVYVDAKTGRLLYHLKTAGDKPYL